MDSQKRVINWVQIEKDYRAGIKNNVQIASEHGISETAIRKQAKKYEWTKDLASIIRATASKMVREQEVRQEVRDSIDDSQVIEENAHIQANVIRGHRKSIGRYSDLCQSLLAEIELQTGNLPKIEEFGEIMYMPDDKGNDKRNELYNRIISSPSRVDSAKKLVETLKTLISLERQAFNIDESGTTEITVEAFLERLD